MVLVPTGSLGTGLPDGMLEIGADESGIEQITLVEVGENLSAGNGCVGADVGKAFGDWVVGGLKVEHAAFDTSPVRGFQFAIPVTPARCLGEGVETAFGAIDDREADVDAGFDELGGNENDGAAFSSQTFCAGEDEHNVAGAHAG